MLIHPSDEPERVLAEGFGQMQGYYESSDDGVPVAWFRGHPVAVQEPIAGWVMVEVPPGFDLTPYAEHGEDGLGGFCIPASVADTWPRRLAEEDDLSGLVTDGRH